MANEKSTTEPKPNFRCRITTAKDLALAAWREVHAVTPADAKEKYLKDMGIIGLEPQHKVEVEGL